MVILQANASKLPIYHNFAVNLGNIDKLFYIHCKSYIVIQKNFEKKAKAAAYSAFPCYKMNILIAEFTFSIRHYSCFMRSYRFVVNVTVITSESSL